MTLEFTGRHIEFTPALKAHVEEHFAKIAHLFDGRPPKAHVIIEVERGMHRSEIVIHWRNDILTAETSVPDMYQSLSQTIAKIEKQARKLKDKVIDKSHKARGVASVTAPADQADLVVSTPRIIEMNTSDSKPMTPDEAALELDRSELQFIVFRHSVTQKVSVLFRRHDGNYGLVQP